MCTLTSIREIWNDGFVDARLLGFDGGSFDLMPLCFVVDFEGVDLCRITVRSIRRNTFAYLAVLLLNS